MTEAYRPHFITQEPTFTWEAREVLRELADLPHLLTRIEVFGTYFPHLDRPVLMRIVTKGGDVVDAWMADVGPNNESLRGYFHVDVPGGVLEFGYGNDLMGRIRLSTRGKPKVSKLTRRRLPSDVIAVTPEYVERRRSPDQPATG